MIFLLCYWGSNFEGNGCIDRPISIFLGEDKILLGDSVNVVDNSDVDSGFVSKFFSRDKDLEEVDKWVDNNYYYDNNNNNNKGTIIFVLTKVFFKFVDYFLKVDKIDDIKSKRLDFFSSWNWVKYSIF